MARRRLLGVALVGAIVGCCCDAAAATASSDEDASASAASTASTATDLKLLTDLTGWLNSTEGGYFNPKQEVRPVPSASSRGEGYGAGPVSYGIFARELIAEGELLNQVPWEYIINDEEDEDPPEGEDNSGDLKCGTVRNVANAMKRQLAAGDGGGGGGGDDNLLKHAPYVRYLLNQPASPLPSAWSKKGRAMLADMLGGPSRKIPPAEAATWLEDDWFDSCDGDESDEVSARAALLVVARADDDLMVPIYDLYNHRNGKYYNTRMKTNVNKTHQVFARRDILPGEQIYNSYNLCDECSGRKNGYGTPEIFRDYGFVENFPQRWDLDEFDVAFDLFEKKDGSVALAWINGKEPTGEEDRAGAKRSLLKELKRLHKIRRLIWVEEWKDGRSSIPENEWDSLWEYHGAVVDAISYALNNLADNASEEVPVMGKDGVCSVESCGDYYDPLDLEKDLLPYNKPTCNNREIMQFPDYYTLDHLKTNYQVLNFAFRKDDGDICMDLDDTVQICSCYRPHYHEFSAHFAARFLSTVQRVIFIGGGDSMLLHETLKYPALEKVVGLELDQMVTRKSLKYFRTQPHFDDDRVEWWFGDATKSLLLLPKDYWGSFDLVLVDLSETVMAFSVTDNLDVFDALALLLKEDGVMVKNELYMSEMSAVFDYTLQIYNPENPKICSQVMAFGSNRADFLHQQAIDHNVKMLLLPPASAMQDKFEFFHDYRKNNALAEGKCNTLNSTQKVEQEKSAGILHVLDAENVQVPLDDTSVETLIRTVAEQHSLVPISVPVGRPGNINSGFVVVVFKEGYVIARSWPEQKYCALDIWLWGGFQQASSFQKQLGAAMKANPLSAFRVVVGGMYGSSTWKNDRDEIGPQVSQHRNCEESGEKDTKFSDEYSQRVVADEVTNLIASKKIIAGVVCGYKDIDDCLNLDVLQKSVKVDQIVPIWTCSDLPRDREHPERISRMLDCETKTSAAIQASLGNRKLDYLVMDPTTPFLMGQIMNSILNVPRYRVQFISEHSILVAWSVDPKHETWQRAFLDRYRKDVRFDPVSRAEVKIIVDGESMELGIVSCGERSIFHNLSVLETKLKKRIHREGKLTDVEIMTINGGLFPFLDEHKSQEFLQSDYDSAPGDKQYEDQMPLGRESILQFEFDAVKDGATMPGLDDMTRYLESTLSKLKHEVTRSESYTAIGDGALIVTAFKEGSAVMVWDGRKHVDINLFLFDDRKEFADSFANSFAHFTTNNLKVGLRDDFPRGLGRVVNFKDDLSYKGIDLVTKLEPYVT